MKSNRGTEAAPAFDAEIEDKQTIAGERIASDEDETPGTYASPPCFMHEFEPIQPLMPRKEVLALLNVLLEGERAGAQAAAEMAAAASDRASRTALKAIAVDEARYCAMLMRHIARLGGAASRETGSFLAKIRTAEPGHPRVDLLNRGQGWVVRRLRQALSQIEDDALRRDLAEMADTHEGNIRRAEHLLR